MVWCPCRGERGPVHVRASAVVLLSPVVAHILEMRVKKGCCVHFGGPIRKMFKSKCIELGCLQEGVKAELGVKDVA